ncbi:hypothetical protein A4A49_03199 [Nicotiana attenuata]|uniref:Uncharacterized protein n=1 Tax=Nicotiana attenuata TaxID=49451 RepID=A0A1J6ISC3_NICAT|nr:hypothetical protein A4A49_03199 [Nicotiana attenuata]
MMNLNRVFMAASVAVVNGYSDHGEKWKSDASDVRLFSGFLGSDLRGSFIGSGIVGETKRKQTDVSLRQVMYLSCWG